MSEHQNNTNDNEIPVNPASIGVLTEDASEADLSKYMMHVRQRLKRWQANHRDSLLGKNMLYGIKAALNMSFAGESLCENINEVIVEKCAI
jgi:hypothetical protein